MLSSLTLISLGPHPLLCVQFYYNFMTNIGFQPRFFSSLVESVERPDFSLTRHCSTLRLSLVCPESSLCCTTQFKNETRICTVYSSAARVSLSIGLTRMILGPVQSPSPPLRTSAVPKGSLPQTIHSTLTRNRLLKLWARLGAD